MGRPHALTHRSPALAPVLMALSYRSVRAAVLAGWRWLGRPLFPIVFSWPGRRSTPPTRIHRAAARALFPEYRHLRWPALTVCTLLWPFKASRLVGAYTRALGPAVAAGTGKSPRIQRCEQLRLAFAHGIAPETYYTFGLHQKALYARASEYLHPYELTALQRVLDGGGAGARVLQDKRSSAELLRQNGVRTARCYAAAENGVLCYAESTRRELPREDLFIKPVLGSRGVGAMLWEYMAPGRYLSASMPAASSESTDQEGPFIVGSAELAKMLERLSLQQPWMVEERLVDHPDLAGISSGGTLSVRILTGRMSGRSEALRATLKIPLGNAIVSNSGLNAPVDRETGVVGRATTYGPVQRWYTTHPDTDVAIEGRIVPHWQACLAAAEAAHACFPEVTFIGWDVVVTAGGPIVLEGNWGWDPVCLQKPHMEPLLHGRFAEICLARLETAPARNKASFRSERVIGHDSPCR